MAVPTIYGQAAMVVQTSWGLRLLLTSPSIMAGSWDSTRALQEPSRLGNNCPMAEHSCSTNSTICCSVVSLVMNSSRSVTISTQRLHNSSLLGALTANPAKHATNNNNSLAILILCVWE